MIINIGRRKSLSDSEYVKQIQQRRKTVTELFYNECRKYFMHSYGAVFSKDNIKEDIFQQSFVKLWTEIETKRIFIGDDDKLYRFDRKGNIRVLTCNLKSFLIDIAKNDYRDWLRKDRLTLEDDFESFAHMMEVSRAVRFDDNQETLKEQIVADCVFDLPPRCKDILTMFYYKGMSLDEILVARGEKNISKNGLKTGKYKCMESLKTRVKDAYKKYNLKY
ncbi:MAG: sigma-70 family RNA polymerase sigma factor [Elusimicrobiales bacterium]|nr:sigma-70 family RNA polymerase sigma factor [Prevotellaceae bacterium]MDO5764909.1 sigma-70 family RNA polymerase sigma factor [Elusimicrobiales bacterium]